MSDDELTQLEKDLTVNALAFLQRSFRQTIDADEDGQQLSFAVVDLAVSIEVLLKARLVREHWTLILEDLDNGRPDRAALISGSAKTVAPGQAVDRLSRLIGLPLGDTKDKKSRAHQVSQVTILRNRAAHFTLATMPPLSIRAHLGVGLQFVLWLLETEFADSPAKTDVGGLLDAMGTELVRVQELVRERLRDLGPELDRAIACVQCPRCSQPTLMFLGFGDAEPACPFCRSITSETDRNQLAEEYVLEVLYLSAYETIKDGGDWPVFDCPECGQEALVGGVRQDRPLHVDDEGPDPVYWGCFACGLAQPSWALDHCRYCYRLCDASQGYTLCVDCAHELMNAD